MTGSVRYPVMDRRGWRQRDDSRLILFFAMEMGGEEAADTVRNDNASKDGFLFALGTYCGGAALCDLRGLIRVA